MERWVFIQLATMSTGSSSFPPIASCGLYSTVSSTQTWTVVTGSTELSGTVIITKRSSIFNTLRCLQARISIRLTRQRLKVRNVWNDTKIFNICHTTCHGYLKSLQHERSTEARVTSKLLLINHQSSSSPN